MTFKYGAIFKDGLSEYSGWYDGEQKKSNIWGSMHPAWTILK